MRTHESIHANTRVYPWHTSPPPLGQRTVRPDLCGTISPRCVYLFLSIYIYPSRSLALDVSLSRLPPSLLRVSLSHTLSRASALSLSFSLIISLSLAQAFDHQMFDHQVSLALKREPWHPQAIETVLLRHTPLPETTPKPNSGTPGRIPKCYVTRCVQHKALTSIA